MLCVLMLSAASLQAVASELTQIEPVSASGRSSAASVSVPQSGSSARQLLAPGTLLALQDAPISLSIAQVATLPDSFFKPFDAAKSYTLNQTTTLWLYFRVENAAAGPVPDLSFDLPKTFVDKVEFYSRQPDGAWARQQAGDALPQTSWAWRGLHPQFHLPALRQGTNEFYVKVAQLLPLRFDPRLRHLEAANDEHQKMLLINGLLLGLMLFVSLYSMVLALVYRDKTYAWYAVYALLATLSAASYIGVGFYALWPASNKWAEGSHAILLMLALAAQVQFCNVLFIDSRAQPRVSLAITCAVLLLACCALSTLMMGANATHWSLITTGAVVSVAGALMLAIVLKAAWQCKIVAWFWLAAYVPLLAAVGLTLVEQFGLMPLPWLPYNAVGLAVGFEVLVLLIAFQVLVKSNHAYAVRQTTLEELDPLSGFVAPLYYPDTLAQMWGEARRFRQDLAIAYVRADVDFDASSTTRQISPDDVVRRCVRMLRIVTRPNDVVARIGTNVFVLLMPGISPGASLAGKLSRLVAVGLMQDLDDPAAVPVRFRLVATSFSSFSGTSIEVDKALKGKLSQLSTSSARGIEFIKNR